MRLVITGSPGTGKSTIASALAAKLGLELIDIKKIVLARKLRGRSGEVDLKRLASALSFLAGKKDYVVEGHLACEIKLPADFVFVLRTRPDALRRRLAARKYGARKLEENLMAEMLDYCAQRAAAVYGKRQLELDTSHRTIASCVLEMEKAIKQKKKKLDSVDYSTALREHLRLGRS
jgi:adenylate kinase